MLLSVTHPLFTPPRAPDGPPRKNRGRAEAEANAGPERSVGPVSRARRPAEAALAVAEIEAVTVRPRQSASLRQTRGNGPAAASGATAELAARPLGSPAAPPRTSPITSEAVQGCPWVTSEGHGAGRGSVAAGHGGGEG